MTRLPGDVNLVELPTCKRGLQLVASPVWKEQKFGDTRLLVAGAAEALDYLA